MFLLHLKSGCIIAVLGAVCVANPDARLSILFLPFFSFSASKVCHGFHCFNHTDCTFNQSEWQKFRFIYGEMISGLMVITGVLFAQNNHDKTLPMFRAVFLPMFSFLLVMYCNLKRNPCYCDVLSLLGFDRTC